jgi:hypothetical protein
MRAVNSTQNQTSEIKETNKGDKGFKIVTKWTDKDDRPFSYPWANKAQTCDVMKQSNKTFYPKTL